MRNRIDEWVVTPISYTAKWLWNPAAVRNVHPPDRRHGHPTMDVTRETST